MQAQDSYISVLLMTENIAPLIRLIDDFGIVREFSQILAPIFLGNCRPENVIVGPK